jgi:ArsR family transcriptional regulator
MFKALGNPTRFEIVKYLVTHPGCITGDIVDFLPLAQATVSQHLKVLREAGWISGEIEGPATCYYLSEENIAWFREKVADIFWVSFFSMVYRKNTMIRKVIWTMGGPITDYELGKIRHCELQSEMGRYRGVSGVEGDRPVFSRRRGLVVVVTGAVAIMLALAGAFPG